MEFLKSDTPGKIITQILVIKVLYIIAVAKFRQLHCSQILKVPYVFCHY